MYVEINITVMIVFQNRSTGIFKQLYFCDEQAHYLLVHQLIVKQKPFHCLSMQVYFGVDKLQSS